MSFSEVKPISKQCPEVINQLRQYDVNICVAEGIKANEMNSKSLLNIFVYLCRYHEKYLNMSSSRRKQSSETMGVLLGTIDSLQAYLQQMKEKLTKGEISDTETEKALQNINLFKV